MTTNKIFDEQGVVEALRKVATGSAGRRHVPVDQQAKLTEELAAKIVAAGEEVTPESIEAAFREELMRPRMIQHFVNEAERAKRRAEHETESWDDQMKAAMARFIRYAHSTANAASGIDDLQRRRPKDAPSVLATEKFLFAIKHLEAAKLQTTMMMRDCLQVNKHWKEIRRGLFICKTALQQLADERTNWSQEKDCPFPIHNELLDRMGAMLEAFARLAEEMGLTPDRQEPSPKGAPQLTSAQWWKKGS